MKIAASSADDPVVRRIENERQALLTLFATTTPALLDFGENDGRPWLIAEWIAGTPVGDCAAEIRERGDRIHADVWLVQRLSRSVAIIRVDE